MNPKNLSHLDPKLREAYERVMGTSAPTPPSPTPTPPITPSGPAPMITTPVQTQENSQSQVVVNKKKGKLSPILVAITVILFFAVYTIIWIVVFGLKIPFLS